MLDATAFDEDLDRDMCPDSDDFLGPDKGTQVRVWFRRFCSLKGFLIPAAALPIQGNFWSLMGRRVRLLSLSDSQRGVILSRGADFRVALRVRRSADPKSVIGVPGGDAAVEASVEKHCICALFVAAREDS